MGKSEEEEKRRRDGTRAPGGKLGEGRASHTQRGPLTTRRSTGTGRDVWRIRGSEGNSAGISPTHSGPSDPGVLEPILPTLRSPSATLSQSPA